MSMKGCPFEDQRHGPPRKVSPKDGKRLNLNKGFIFSIFGMKMRRIVIVEVHPNHNPKESSYLGHSFLRFYSLRDSNTTAEDAVNVLLGVWRPSRAAYILKTACGRGGVSKQYRDMTPSERLADRIQKNRQIEQGLPSGRAGLSLENIVARLDAGRQRATYGAVAHLVGVLPRGLMSRRPKSYKHSWVVAATTGQDSRRGWPTGYSTNQIHPDCYRQAIDGVGRIIEDVEALKEWLNGTT
jgi:hypothetical protein